jgi:hypothetical protein
VLFDPIYDSFPYFIHGHLAGHQAATACPHFLCEPIDACQVAAWPRQTGDESKLDRVSPPTKTIGIVVVAALAANAEVPTVAIRATRRVPHRFFTHQQAKLGDRHVYVSRSRFIPDSILGSFATRNWRDLIDSQIEAAGRKARSSIDVAASLMRMWR